MKKQPKAETMWMGQYDDGSFVPSTAAFCEKVCKHNIRFAHGSPRGVKAVEVRITPVKRKAKK